MKKTPTVLSKKKNRKMSGQTIPSGSGRSRAGNQARGMNH
jgi:hypothetical protein